MEIIITDNRISQGKTNVTGDIFFKTDSGFFPEENWNNFVLIIAANWINEYLSFLNSSGSRTFTLCFMDGASEVVGTLKDSGNYCLEYVRLYIDSKDVIFTEIVSKADFEKQLTKACRKSMRIASTFDMNEQVGNFRKMLDKLKYINPV